MRTKPGMGSVHGDKNCDKGGVREELVVDILSDPLVVHGGVGVRTDLARQFRLDPHQGKKKAEAAIFQDLHHAVLIQLYSQCKITANSE